MVKDVPPIRALPAPPPRVLLLPTHAGTRRALDWQDRRWLPRHRDSIEGTPAIVWLVPAHRRGGARNPRLPAWLSGDSATADTPRAPSLQMRPRPPHTPPRP